MESQNTLNLLQPLQFQIGSGIDTTQRKPDKIIDNKPVKSDLEHSLKSVLKLLRLHTGTANISYNTSRNEVSSQEVDALIIFLQQNSDSLDGFVDIEKAIETINAACGAGQIKPQTAVTTDITIRSRIHDLFLQLLAYKRSTEVSSSWLSEGAASQSNQYKERQNRHQNVRTDAQAIESLEKSMTSESPYDRYKRKKFEYFAELKKLAPFYNTEAQTYSVPLQNLHSDTVLLFTRQMNRYNELIRLAGDAQVGADANEDSGIGLVHGWMTLENGRPVNPWNQLVKNLNDRLTTKLYGVTPQKEIINNAKKVPLPKRMPESRFRFTKPKLPSFLRKTIPFFFSGLLMFGGSAGLVRSYSYVSQRNAPQEQIHTKISTKVGEIMLNISIALSKNNQLKIELPSQVAQEFAQYQAIKMEDLYVENGSVMSDQEVVRYANTYALYSRFNGFEENLISKAIQLIKEQSQRNQYWSRWKTALGPLSGLIWQNHNLSGTDINNLPGDQQKFGPYGIEIAQMDKSQTNPEFVTLTLKLVPDITGVANPVGTDVK